MSGVLSYGVVQVLGSDGRHEVVGIQGALAGSFSVGTEGLANEVLALLGYI